MTKYLKYTLATQWVGTEIEGVLAVDDDVSDSTILDDLWHRAIEEHGIDAYMEEITEEEAEDYDIEEYYY